MAGSLVSRLRGLLGGRADLKRAAQVWSDEIQRAARDPAPYLAGWVADTRDGRFHMVALYSALVLRRLREEGADGRALAERVYRLVFDGFDYALREEGVGDSSIARKIRKMGEEFFGLARAVDAALSGAEPEAVLAEVLVRNAIVAERYGRALAAHVLTGEARLRGLHRAEVLAGHAIALKDQSTTR